jgi:protein-glutamine gamma-glutamyltransferase
VSGVVRRPAAAVAHGPDAVPSPAASAGAENRLATPVRLAVFAALGAFGAVHWASLVADLPVGRTLLAVLVATGGAGVLALLGATVVRDRLGSLLGGRLAGLSIVGIALIAGIVTIALALAAIGLPVRLLGPGNWQELVDGLDRGLAGVQGVEWPYDGADDWIRLSILLGAPFLLGIAAILGFFPARRGAPVLRVAALVVLLLLYGMPVTEHDPGEPLLRGLVLLVLVAAWLWLPRLAPREAAAGAGLVLSLGLISLPVAATMDSERRWLDYRGWSWFGAGSSVTFDWTHQYGPLDWPREGTTLLNVRSDRSHYWKAETLDAFDGLRWVRGRTSDIGEGPTGLPNPSSRDGRWDYFEWNPRWDEEIRFTVRSLSSDLLAAAGTTYRVDDAGFVSVAGDGTIRTTSGPLEQGDSYAISTYDPKPSERQMRRAPDYLPSTLQRYTTIELPRPDESALDPRTPIALGGEEIFMPLWGSTDFADPGAPRRALESSDYGDMYRIATDVVADAPSMYDAVARVEQYLNRNYTYSEKTPRARLPLNAFLFRDEFGYCQQFSGAMALMLRMVGIPARVAAGFAPGSFNRDSGEYRVRDLDAHSWVEVYFNGIGWVTFDPTPAASPAEAQAADLAPSTSTAAAINQSRSGAAASERAAEGATSPRAETDSGTSAWLLLLLLVLVVPVLVVFRLSRRSRRLSSDELAEAQLAELHRALGRLDWDVPTATTLLGLERRLDRAAGPASARYAAELRAHRYDPGTPQGPSLTERRALRRELTARGGLLGRLRGLLAIPPGGPRPV